MVYKGILDVRPKQGLCELRFGATMQEAESYFGKPEAVEHIDEIEQYRSIVWHYWKRGFSLFFDDTHKNTFSCVELDDERALLWANEVFKMDETQILKLFQEKGFLEVDREEHKWGEKRVSLDDAMVDLYFENESLVSINYCIPHNFDTVLILPN